MDRKKMDGWIEKIDGWLERRITNNENKIDGWLDGQKKNI